VVEFDPENYVRLWDLTGTRPAEAGRLGIGLRGIKRSHALMVTFAPDGKALLAG
jgi:hypothetical protein